MPGPATFTPVVLDGFADRVRIRVGAVATPPLPTIVVEELTEQNTYTSADTFRTPGPGENELSLIVFGTRSTPSSFEEATLYLLNNSVPGVITSDPERALNWVSYGLWHRVETTLGRKRISAFTFGTVTAATDMPTTGISDYTMHVSGYGFSSEPQSGNYTAKLSGNFNGVVTSTTRVNYATGVVTVAVVLNQFNNGGVLDRLSGTGTIQAGTNRFTGTLTSTTGSTAAFQGYAYGPRAAEIGLVIGMDNGFSTIGRSARAIAVMVGRKR